MTRNFAFGGPIRQAVRPFGRCASSLACLAFVALLGAAFWAGAAWIAGLALRLSSPGG